MICLWRLLWGRCKMWQNAWQSTCHVQLLRKSELPWLPSSIIPLTVETVTMSLWNPLFTKLNHSSSFWHRQWLWMADQRLSYPLTLQASREADLGGGGGCQHALSTFYVSEAKSCFLSRSAIIINKTSLRSFEGKYYIVMKTVDMPSFPRSSR